MFSDEDYMKILEFSMKDFIANNDIIAGFPWFGAWGRDTMIALEGVLRLEGGAIIAQKILGKYTAQIINGLIPNMCSESQQQANYNSIDGTLWFILRLYQVNLALNDAIKETNKVSSERWKNCIEVANSMLESIVLKPHNDFHMREDGLLSLNESFAWATWMDAKVHDKPVTPRNGAPIEVNALLYNALCAFEKMVEEHNSKVNTKQNIFTNQAFLEAKAKIKTSFDKFWIGDYLADRLLGDEQLKEYRPNAIVATSLPFTNQLLTLNKLQQIYETAHAELFTPYGIRSLSPKDSKFNKKYIGVVEERDKAYHQGTVWGWLTLPFVQTWLNAYPNKSAEEAINHISYIVSKLRNGYKRGHIASVAEVWDGDKPHFPKGCPAQAWSVSALFTIECMIRDLKGGEL
jgi:predicted glycogen debranching enzyme